MLFRSPSVTLDLTRRTRVSVVGDYYEQKAVAGMNALIDSFSGWDGRTVYSGIQPSTLPSQSAFGASRIPVFVNNRFVYSPSLHRQLQLAANLWDAVNGTNDASGGLPTVFRPIFTRDAQDNVFISDFKVVDNFGQLSGLTLRDLSDTNSAKNIQPDDLVFGVPLVIGARKGLPNFNEFSAETVVSVTRKVELRKRAAGGANMINETNQMFVIGVSNVFGAEFWNSYTKLYQRPVDIFVSNYCTVQLTNDYGYKLTTDPVFNNRSFLRASVVVSSNTWPAWDPKRTAPPSAGPWSFVVPLRSNHIIIPDSAYRISGNRFDPVTTQFERNGGTAFPRWGLAITNRVVAWIKEHGGQNRIIDYEIGRAHV